MLTHRTTSGAAGFGGSAGPSLGCDARDLVCLDFEDGAAPIPSLTLVAPTGTADYDATTSGAGQQSVRIELDAEQSYVIEVASTSTITSGSLYLRGMFQLPGGYQPGSYFVLMEAVEAQAQRKVSFDWRPEGFGINANGPTSFAATPLPRDQWFCAELGINIAETGGHSRLSIDGVVAAELAEFDSSLGGAGLSRFRIGANAGTGNDPLQLHVDDFVVRTEPIGCP